MVLVILVICYVGLLLMPVVMFVRLAILVCGYGCWFTSFYCGCLLSVVDVVSFSLMVVVLLCLVNSVDVIYFYLCL